MRIDRVHAHAFGPFRDEQLEFAPRMTVIHGPNESGKSSWHAAIYGGLCGLRHVGGPPPAQDRIYEERHRPWDGGDEWRASVFVTLDTGRRLHFHGDLDGRDDFVVDMDTGRDVVSELDLENDNAPDGARLLGLTRRTILATIQVKQADVLHVLEAPDGLQEHLQQAAATGGDVTAESAIERLDDFHSEHVGTLAWNSKRPLKAAHDAVDAAEAELARVRAAHDGYVDLHSRLVDARDRADELLVQVQAAEAVMARQELAERQQEHERAAALAAGLPDERPAPVTEDERIEAVTDAIAAWENRPEIPSVPDGPSVEELEARLAALPPPPEGETAPAADVERAADALEDARRRLAYHEDGEPPAVAPAAVDEHGDVEAVPVWPRSRLGLVGGGGTLAAAGAGILATGATTAGLVLVVAGVAVAVLGLLRPRRGGRGPGLVERRVAERERGTWQRRRERLADEVDEKENALRAILTRRGADGGSGTRAPVQELLRTYLDSCRRRAEQAEEAARRGGLESRLEARREAEAAVRRARERREQARRRLREVADRVGVTADEPAGVIAALRGWRASVRDDHDERAAERDRWTEFRAVMDGRTLAEMEARVEGLRRSLPPMPEEIARGEAERMAARLDELRDRAADARETVARLEGRIHDNEGALDSVVEAEEELERARADRERVQELDDTLTRTREFLDEARARVQREFAPLLREAVEAELPRITLGRYSHVRVDPDSLDVQVSPDGIRWRHANRLSRGTAEQIYLLLRVAMAEHAVTTDERAPLILDDVTVQSDRTRTVRFLELLHGLSEERQVIVFTQEPDVVDWARRTLHGDAVLELDPSTIPP